MIISPGITPMNALAISWEWGHRRNGSVLMEKGETMIQIDMPMPENCQECPIYDEYGECLFLGTFAAQYGRLPDCPLREVEE